jgi:hypothetical protein
MVRDDAAIGGAIHAHAGEYAADQSVGHAEELVGEWAKPAPGVADIVDSLAIPLSDIATPVERQSRLVIIVELPTSEPNSLQQG